MTTQFKILFAVSIDHGYYTEGSQGFDFVIPEDTARLLRNGKMLTKVRDGALYVLFEANEAGVALIPSTGQRLRFGLKLLNPFFSNVTDLGFDVDTATPLYQNITNTLAPVKEPVLVGALFGHILTKDERPVTATLKDRAGQPVVVTLGGGAGQRLQTETITSTGVANISFDLTGKDAGVYTVEETYPSGTVSVLYYSDTALLQLGIFGVIEIDIDGSFYTTAPDFKITFEAKEETLKYYLIAKNYTDTEFNQFSVSDVGFSADKRPQIKFKRIARSKIKDEGIDPALLLGEGGKKLTLFKSIKKVARQEKARKKIQLSKNGTVLVTHLPQPGIDRSNSDLYVQVSKP